MTVLITTLDRGFVTGIVEWLCDLCRAAEKHVTKTEEPPHVLACQGTRCQTQRLRAGGAKKPRRAP